MSLQGTFDTLSVLELFGLLSTAGKTGALQLEGHDSDGSADSTAASKAAVFVSAGLCCAVESDQANGPSGSVDELAARLVDVGFSLTRSPSGSFRFVDAERPPFDTEFTAPLEPAIAAIEAMVEQWREIEAAIPSLDARVRLVAEMRTEEIVISAAEWRLLAGLEAVPSVRAMVAHHGRPMIELCRSLKDLVDRGAIEIGTDFEVPAARSGALIEIGAPYAPEDKAPRHREFEAVATAVDAIAAAEAADAAADAEADAVAAGLVNRMSRSRRPVPDVFADSDADSDLDTDDRDEVRDSDESPSVDRPTAAAADTPAADDDASDVPQDRGALLRLFSALKE